MRRNRVSSKREEMSGPTTETDAYQFEAVFSIENGAGMDTTRDKNGKEIRIGDVLKVFHFIGARRKKHYMYKQVIGERLLGGLIDGRKTSYFVISHLDLTDDNYYLGKSEGILPDYEILQGLDDIDARPKQ